MTPAEQDLRLRTPAEVAELFRISERTVKSRANARRWPFTWAGREIRFSAADIEAIIQLGKQQPTGTTPPQPRNARPRRLNRA